MLAIKLEKITVPRTLALLSALTCVMAAFLIGSQSYFNSKEISNASEKCLKNEGVVIVEKTMLNLDYTFSCK